MTNQWVWHPGFDFADDYHTYTLVWKEGDIQKWVDDTQVKGTYFTWNGSAPFTYTYAWLRCDTSGNNCTTISGATSSTYTLASAASTFG